MTLRLIREPSVARSTLGVLFVDDRFECFTLEDQVREIPGRAVADWKVYGETAIKAGRYRVILSMSNRFGRVLPELLHVDGFTGVRVHAGNRRLDSLGCVLVGRSRGDAQIFESRRALEALMATLVEARPGSIELLIENPPSYQPVVA